MNDEPAVHPELGREVAIASIDAELHKLWSADDARTNASLVNLAVYSERPGCLEKNSELIRELTREHACRAILVGIDRETDEASIRAWITAHCHLSHGQKSVCCEQIAFALTGRATGRLRNTVFAHLNSDLPLIVWWQGELSPIFTERFYNLVDRFVFDSRDWSQPEESFGRIANAMEDSKGLVAQDLSWSRSYQVRVSLAALFDDPVAQAALPSVEAVEIVHHPDHRMAALQLLAWLAVQAKWTEGAELDLEVATKVEGKEGFSFESERGKGLTATLESRDDEAPIGALVVTAGEVRIEVSQAAGGRFLTRILEAPGHVARSPGPVDPESSAGLLAEQLSRGGKNSLFVKILPVFRELLGAGGVG